MKCDVKQQDREEKISLYIDRQLDWKEEKEFLKHIKQCEECNKALQQAKQIREMLLTLPDEDVTDEVLEEAKNMNSILTEVAFFRTSPSMTLPMSSQPLTHTRVGANMLFRLFWLFR